MAQTLRLTRGERNHNPGNLEGNAEWRGLVPRRDGPFLVFQDAVSGIRALALNIRNQQTLHGLRTVWSIINKFAPPSENATSAYVAAVSAYLVVDSMAFLDLTDRPTLAHFTRAIILHENGRCIYSAKDIDAAILWLPHIPYPYIWNDNV